MEKITVAVVHAGYDGLPLADRLQEMPGQRVCQIAAASILQSKNQTVFPMFLAMRGAGR